MEEIIILVLIDPYQQGQLPDKPITLQQMMILPVSRSPHSYYVDHNIQ